MTRARSLSQLANSSVFTVATNNRVGIGSEVPTAKLDVDGTLNVSGNATIGGVATYEDVTNVDSVGIVTARSGVSVPDGQKIQLGNSNDLQIYHTGSHSLIDEAGTGNLVIRSNLISFEKYTNEQLARFTADGSCELFHDNSKKLETTSGGVSVTGAGTFSGLITANGNILSNRTGSTQTVFQGTLSGVTKVNIQAGGAATFAGAISVDGGTTNENSTYGPGYLIQNRSQAVRNLWTGQLNGSNTSTILADGSATFAGGDFAISSSGNLAINRTSGTNDILNGKLNGSVTSTINADGSATFGQASNSTNNNGILLGANVGQLNLYTTRYSTDCFQILNTSGSGTNVAVRFDGDGTATFAGSVSATVGSFSGNVTSARTSSSHTCFNGTLNGTTTSNILANGNATFDGGITSKQEVYVLGTTTSTQRYLNFADAGTSNYRATLRRDAWYLGAPVTNIGDVTPSGANIVLNMSGSATFAGAVDVGTFSSGTSGIRLTNTGTIYIGGTGNNAGLNIGNSAAVIDYDGSAAFAARFSPGTSSLNDHAIVAINNNFSNGTVLAQNHNASGAVFQGYNGSSKNVEIFGSGSATFAGGNAIINSSGQFENYSVVANQASFKIRNVANTAWVTLLRGDGSARFGGGTTEIFANGEVQFGNNSINFQPGGSATFAANVECRNFDAKRPSGSTADVFAGFQGTNVTSQIFADGKATFGTDVTVSSGRFDSSVGGNSSYLYIGRLGSTIKYHVLGDGSAYFAGNITAGNVSDIKFKENITDANPQLSDVVALGGILKNWDWKEESPLNEELRAKRFLGLVAQEAEVICPGVTYEVGEGEDSYKAINHDILVMKLLGAVAELKSEVEALKNA